MIHKNSIRTLFLFLILAGIFFISGYAKGISNSAGKSKGKNLPQLLYLDIESGPPGVFLTLNGKGFSIEDKILIGNTLAAPLPKRNQYQPIDMVPSRVTVVVPQLPDECFQVTVETSEGFSNELPFTVRPGNVYHIAKSGDNNYPGLGIFPWLTLNYGISQLKPGDFIYVHRGVYNLNPDRRQTSLNLMSEQEHSLSFSSDEDEVIPITFQGYPGEKVLITSVNWNPLAMNFEGPYAINIIGFSISNIESNIIDLKEASDNGVLKGVRFINNAIYEGDLIDYGIEHIQILSDLDRVQILGNSILQTHTRWKFDDSCTRCSKNQHIRIEYNHIRNGHNHDKSTGEFAKGSFKSGSSIKLMKNP